jgi:hypothetical protein
MLAWLTTIIVFSMLLQRRHKLCVPTSGHGAIEIYLNVDSIQLKRAKNVSAVVRNVFENLDNTKKVVDREILVLR